MRDVRYYSARNDELQKENDAIMDILSKHGFDGDKEIVRLVKRNLTLTKENEKLLSKMETMEGESGQLREIAKMVKEGGCTEIEDVCKYCGINVQREEHFFNCLYVLSFKALPTNKDGE